MFDSTRPGRFAPLWAVVVMVATLASLVVNVAPAVAALVAPTAPVTVAAIAPLAPVVQAAPVVQVAEDDPRWDCRTMGNRICGYGTDQGPVGTLAGGTLSAWCPPGGALVDLPWVPLGPTTDLVTVMRSIGCRY